jgi:hypothetical protein
MDIVEYFLKKYPQLEGWRKLKYWRRELKNNMRALGRASASGGKGKEERQQKSALEYISKAKAFSEKLAKSFSGFPAQSAGDIIRIISLEEFKKLLNKHIDLVERRLIKKEVIPHEEKMFSIFEQYTEWITKGKLRPSVELGKKLAITSDQFHLIVDYRVMDHESDSEIVIPLADTLKEKFLIWSWSFDKGFFKKENKELLKLN